ncbi:MAG: ABC transporter ATP-binding protein [Oscillospiraceae bacterium]|nr:ABC transporter ATP-binding protein [Oscillospiraceae bacterium]
MIELKNLFAGYSKNDILKNINMQFEKGKTVSVIGPNGSGKSTLIQCCTGILEPTSGEIIIDGKSISEYKEKSLARTVSYLPQINPVSSITVRSLVMHGRFPYLGYPRRYSEEDKSIAEKAIAAAGIEEIADKPLSELSGGQQQKAHIAMRLAQNTDYIFFDEPITYLDIKYKLEFAGLMKRLRNSGKAVVAVLHDINMAFTHSDKIAIIDRGELALFDTPENAAKSGAIENVFGVKLLKSEFGQYFFTVE